MCASGWTFTTFTDYWGSEMLKESDAAQGLLLNFTGNGKGKTSAALGVTLRALGWDWQVAFVQFVKGHLTTGEMKFFAKHLPQVMFKQYGLGCTFMNEGDHEGSALQGWQEARNLLQSFPGQLLVLDELNIALDQGFIPVEEAVSVLVSRRPELNVIITGRYAQQEVVEICDLVSEIVPLKHPMEQGIGAVAGLDY